MISTLARGLALLVVVAVLAACAAAPPSDLGGDSHPPSLAGTTWEVVLIGDVEPPAGHAPTVMFEPNAVRGSSGCNQFGGRYRYSAGVIQVTDLGGTAAACLDQGVMEVERQFMQALGAASQVSVDAGGRLVIAGAGGRLVLRVAPVGVPGAAPPAP